MRLLGTGLVLASLTLTACGGNDDPPPTPEPVSVQTTCDLLFVDDDPRLWSQAVAAMTDRSANIAAAEQLHDAAAASEGELKPHIEAMADAAENPAAADVGDFKTAAREVANVCTPYVATG
jgi:hypothetical protein